VIDHAAAAGKFEFWPELEWVAIITFVAGLLTMGFGSVPQQDVFQRANASKNETVAVWGTVIGGVAYLLFAAVPLYLTYAATLVDPALRPVALPRTRNGAPHLRQPAFALGGSDHFLRRPAVGDHVDRLRHPAGAFGDHLGKHPQRLSFGKNLTDQHFLCHYPWCRRGFQRRVVLYSLWSLEQRGHDSRAWCLTPTR
jgi:hypothetical protein